MKSVSLFDIRFSMFGNLKQKDTKFHRETIHQKQPCPYVSVTDRGGFGKFSCQLSVNNYQFFGNILFVKFLKIENLVKSKLGVPQMATRAGFGYQCSGVQISPPRQNGKVAQLVERWFEEPCQRKTGRRRSIPTLSTMNISMPNTLKIRE